MDEDNIDTEEESSVIGISLDNENEDGGIAIIMDLDPNEGEWSYSLPLEISSHFCGGTNHQNVNMSAEVNEEDCWALSNIFYQAAEALAARCEELDLEEKIKVGGEVV